VRFSGAVTAGTLTSMSSTIASIGGEFQREIVDTGRLASFFFFIALLGTFGFIRTSTHMIRAQVSWWPGNVSVGGTHVHHLVWGIIAMMIFGYIGVVHQPESPWREIVSVFFGIGAGLTLDEFALWVELKDVYWEKDGRKSVDAMIIAGCVAGLGLVGFSAWTTLADDVETGVFAIVGFFGTFGVLIAIVNLLKEKFLMAGVALLFWPAATVAAVRLAKPRSLWARLLYRKRRLLPHGERKLERSRARYPEADAGSGSAGPSPPPPASSSEAEPTAAGQSSS
jgi:lysyl-tRNA synthetase, class II